MAKYVEINGNQVMDLTPDFTRPLALVDITVLKHLTDLLPKADFGQIRHGLREQLMANTNIVDLVATCEDFISFHRSVNLIREVLQSEIQDVREPDENNHLYD
jgi:hypothetical protein